jgi:NitT/TauT family transport system ATP-binding protein
MRSFAPDMPAQNVTPTTSFLQMQELNKVYGSGARAVRALQDVNLDIQQGEFVSIVGPSGCGKSTLMRCIAGLERISSGSLTLKSEPIIAPPTNMGVVFQRDLLMDWRNILDNVLAAAEFHDLPRAQYVDRAKELLSLFGLGAFMDRRPRELSGGMRQRASICRALLLDPQLLLMDEPFGALDPFTRDELNFELQKTWLQTGKTVVFITHSINEAVYLGGRVVIMARSPGRIAEVIPIELERPRGLDVRETPQFSTYVAHIRDTFKKLGIYKA